MAVLTDYGSQDAYVGVLYGAILTRCPDARIAPITHEIPDFDIRAASFVLGMAAEAYPERTVFCTVVDPGVGTDRRSIVLRTGEGRLFVGPDNGTFTDVITQQGLDSAWALDEGAFTGHASLSQTFHGRDVYGPVAGLLATGRAPETLGTRITDPVMFAITLPKRTGSRLEGEIRHIDAYGNIVTNIPGGWVASGDDQAGRRITVAIGDVSRDFVAGRTYADVTEGEGVLLINSLGLVELARNLAPAREWFPNAQTGDVVHVALDTEWSRG